MTQASSGDTVKIHFVGKLTDGSVFDQSKGSEPLEFKIGEGKIIPDLEDGIVGMGVGDKKVINIPSDSAYGAYVDELVIHVPKSEFPGEINFEEGQFLQIDDQKGGMHTVKVLKITDEKVSLDANHPLAGKDLVFEVELLEIA